MTSTLLENVSLTELPTTEAAKAANAGSKPRRSWKNSQYRQNGRRAYICKVKDCMKIFNHLSSLIKHERIHRGERPYACKVCDQKFVQSSNLRRHEKTHTGEKSFACPQCDKKFSTASNLRQHAQIHKEETNRKHYECTTCGRSYLYLSSLNKHVKYCNKEETSCDSGVNIENSLRHEEEPLIKKQVKLDTKIEEIPETNNKFTFKSLTADTQLEVSSQLNFSQTMPVVYSKVPSHSSLSMINYLAKAGNTLGATTIQYPLYTQQQQQLQQQPFTTNTLFSARSQLLQDLSFQANSNILMPSITPVSKICLTNSMLTPSLCSVNYPDVSLLLYQKQKLQEYNLQKRSLGLDLATRIPFF